MTISGGPGFRAIGRRRVTPLLLLALLSWAVQGGSAQTPVIDDRANVAGLVVDYGNGQRSYAVVPFTEPSITGIELLRRSGLPLVSVPFGGLGEGVCSIQSTGCDVATCRRRLCQSADRESPFWQYLRQGDDGSWAPAALGATQARVEDGDVDAWVWIGTPPRLPPTDIGSLRERLNVPSGWPSDGTGVPEPIVRTDGGSTAVGPDEDATWRQVVPGLAVIAGVGGVGWYMTKRTRRSRPRAR